MATYTKTIRIPKEEAKYLQGLLNVTTFASDYGQDTVIHTYTADFGNGIEADIKVCNGEGPWIDSVLFLNGHEIQVLDVSADLLGEYNFSYNNKHYNVILK